MADTADASGRPGARGGGTIPSRAADSRAAARFRPERLRRISLATLFGVLFGGLIAAALALVLTLVVIANARNTLSLLNEKAVLLVSLLRTDATATLRPIEQTLKTFQEIFADSDAADVDQPNDLLVEGVLAGAPNVKAFLLVDPNLKPQGMIRDDSGEFVRWEPNEAETGVVADSLRKLKPGDGPRWGTPVVVAGHTYLYAGAPLVRDAELEGYAVAAIGTDPLFDRFAQVSRVYHATPFLIYGRDRLLLGGESAELDCTDGCAALRPLANVADPVLRRYSDRQETIGFGRALESGVSVSVVETNQTREGHILVTEDLDTLTDLPLTLGVYIGEAAASGELKRLVGSAATGAVIALIAVVLAVLIGRRLARAVGRTAHEAHHIAALRFDEIAPLPRSRIAEIDVEAQAFNSMTEALRTFARYVPGDFVRRLIAEGYSAASRSEVRPAAVMFTDIVGFTALSEHMTAQQSADLLNAHFSLIVDSVAATGGVVDKFMGDGSMSFWVLPGGSDAARAAASAAMAVADSVAAQVARARACGETPLRVRVGIHCGDVILGNVGPPDRVNYTVVGDAVNVAARLEQLGRTVAPEADAVILVSGAVAGAISGRIERQSVGSVPLRNREQRVEVWRIWKRAR